MPFSIERTELIKARIQEKLTVGNPNDWERSFLTSMQKQFARTGTQTRLSDAQYGKLHKLLKLGDGTAAENSKSATLHQNRPVRPQAPSQPRRKTTSSFSPRYKPRIMPRSPFWIVNAPRKAIRRFERQLFLPIIVVIAFFALIGSAFGPTTSTQKMNNATYVFVTGSRVNQREGPSSVNRVMGQLTEGARVQKLSEQGGWTQIVSTLGAGWMSSNFLSSRGAMVTERATNRPTPSLSSQNVRMVQARDIRVIDGDTVAITGQRATVRLIGFNTPETRSPACSAELEVGRRATSRLSELVRGAQSIEFRRVACACRPGTEGTSRCNFGRQCGSIIVDGTDVGKTLISERLAVPYQCGPTSCPRRPGNWCR